MMQRTAPIARSEFDRPEGPNFPEASRGHLWPACLTWADALAYSSLSDSQLRRWKKEGALTVRRAGPHGANLILRSELDRLLESLFDRRDIEEDFDFG